MRVLFLANASSIHTVKWVNALVNRNIEVHLIYLNGDEPSNNEIDSKVVTYKLNYSGTKGYFMNVLELRRLFRKINPDVINAHYASGYGTLARLSRLKPLVLSVWGSDVYNFPYKNSINRRLVVDNLKYADAIASTSFCMAEQVKSLGNFKKNKIHVTPFGVDVKKFKSSNKNRSNKNIIIGNIKTLAPTYGIDILVKSIKVLENNLEKKKLSELSKLIKVYIYGEGDQKEDLQNLIKALRLEKKVFLKGSIPNNQVPRALEEMDIFCITSLNESFGVAVVEAMALELPVVATDTEGFKEVLQPNVTGYIVEKNNIDEIANALEVLILNEHLRNSMGEKGRERVLKLYNWEKNVDSMIDLYTEVNKK